MLSFRFYWKVFATLRPRTGAPSRPCELGFDGVKSLEILDAALRQNEWLTLGRPTIADIGVFVYVALAPMGDISLEPYPAVRAWIERIKKLPNFFPIQGLDDPLYRRRGQKAA